MLNNNVSARPEIWHRADVSGTSDKDERRFKRTLIEPQMNADHLIIELF
jgi:hypothetical protein